MTRSAIDDSTPFFCERPPAVALLFDAELDRAVVLAVDRLAAFAVDLPAVGLALALAPVDFAADDLGFEAGEALLAVDLADRVPLVRFEAALPAVDAFLPDEVFVREGAARFEAEDFPEFFDVLVPAIFRFLRNCFELMTGPCAKLVPEDGKLLCGQQ